MFIFTPDSVEEENDWKSDGHSWSNEGTKKIPIGEFEIQKRHFKLLLGVVKGKKTLEKGFKKVAYTLPPSSDGMPCTTVVHYMGDHTLSVPRAHGNAKNAKKVFVRIQPSVMKWMEDRVKSRENPHQIYKKAVSEGVSKNGITYCIIIYYIIIFKLN